MIKYGIRALQGNGVWVYFVSSCTQGEKMVPWAGSLATLFDSKKEAKTKSIKLAEFYAGLSCFTVYQDI